MGSSILLDSYLPAQKAKLEAVIENRESLTPYLMQLHEDLWTTIYIAGRCKHHQALEAIAEVFNLPFTVLRLGENSPEERGNWAAAPAHAISGFLFSTSTLAAGLSRNPGEHGSTLLANAGVVWERHLEPWLDTLEVFPNGQGVSDCGGGATLQPTRDWSISVWVKTTAGLGTVAARAGGTWAVTMNGGNVVVDVKLTGVAAPEQVSSSQSIRDGNWHHIVATLTLNTSYKRLRIYVDGTLAQSKVLPVGDDAELDMSLGPSVLAFGAEPGPDAPLGQFDKFYLGSIDDPRIYDVELSQQQVQNLMSCQDDRTCNLVVAPVAWWPMGEEPLEEKYRDLRYLDFVTNTGNVDPYGVRSKASTYDGKSQYAVTRDFAGPHTASTYLTMKKQGDMARGVSSPAHCNALFPTDAHLAGSALMMKIANAQSHDLDIEVTQDAADHIQTFLDILEAQALPVTTASGNGLIVGGGRHWQESSYAWAGFDEDNHPEPLEPDGPWFPPSDNSTSPVRGIGMRLDHARWIPQVLVAFKDYGHFWPRTETPQPDGSVILKGYDPPLDETMAKVGRAFADLVFQPSPDGEHPVAANYLDGHNGWVHSELGTSGDGWGPYMLSTELFIGSWGLLKDWAPVVGYRMSSLWNLATVWTGTGDSAHVRSTYYGMMWLNHTLVKEYDEGVWNQVSSPMILGLTSQLADRRVSVVPEVMAVMGLVCFAVFSTYTYRKALAASEAAAWKRAHADHVHDAKDLTDEQLERMNLGFGNDRYTLLSSEEDETSTPRRTMGDHSGTDTSGSTSRRRKTTIKWDWV